MQRCLVGSVGRTIGYGKAVTLSEHSQQVAVLDKAQATQNAIRMYEVCCLQQKINSIELLAGNLSDL
jgi:hypothetical protein